MSNYATNAGSGGTTFQSDTEAGVSADIPGVKLWVGAAGSAQRLLAGSQTAANSLSTALASDQLSAKNAQAANFLPVQQAHDSGRTYVTIYLDAVTGITTEALASMNINKGGTVTTGTSYTVTTGKTLRLMFFGSSVKNTTTTAVNSRMRVRSAATVSATSGIVVANECGTYAAVANVTGADDSSFSEGIEIAGGQQIGISHIESATSATVSCCLVGFEY
ncbi:MAG: hypothetical protein KGL39_23705 [Patescibacteria group bacterium]|nr:hypothetical protein [Patescibacteria group bacterium]